MVDARTFDLFAPDEALVYPTDSLKVYRNRRAVYDWQKLRARLDKTANSDEAAALEAKMAELDAEIQQSALTLSMKALPPEAIKALTDSIPEQPVAEDATEKDRQAAENARNKAVNAALLEAMLVSITNSEGVAAAHPGPRTSGWVDSLPPEVQQAILGKMSELAFASLEFAAETESADF